MFCRNCGNELKEEEKFCGKCGKKVNGEIVKKDCVNKKQPIKIKFTHLMIIIGVVVIFAGVAISMNISNNDGLMQKAKNASDNYNNGSTSQQSTKIVENKLSIDNVEINKKFTTSNFNSSTEIICAALWDKIKDTFPNASWTSSEILETDGFGRFIVGIKYVRSKVSEDTDYTFGLVATTDELIKERKAACLIWGPNSFNYTNSYGWGTPLE